MDPFQVPVGIAPVFQGNSYEITLVQDSSVVKSMDWRRRRHLHRMRHLHGIEAEGGGMKAEGKGGEALGWAAGIEEALEDHLGGDAISALAALLVGEAGLDQDGFCCPRGKAFIPEDDRQSRDVG